MKRYLLNIFLVLLILMPGTAVHAAAPAIDKSQLLHGVVSVNYQPAKNVAAKIMISKDRLDYTYNLNEDSRLPLQLGNGKYTISILENITGNKYRIVRQEQLNVNMTDEYAVYLQPMQLVNWDGEMEVIKMAQRLVADAEDDLGKLTAVYNYVTAAISYDYPKAEKISPDYLPSITETAETGKGICFDYASLTAAMLRSTGVPAKLVMGYKNDIDQYHAWNLVYLRESNEWITIDTAYDSILLQNGLPVDMKKMVSDYAAEKQY